MISEIQDYEQRRHRQSRKETLWRSAVYLMLILGCFAFWIGVFIAATS